MKAVQLTIVFNDDDSLERIQGVVDDIKNNTECVENPPKVTYIMCHDESQILWEESLSQEKTASVEQRFAALDKEIQQLWRAVNDKPSRPY